MKRVKHFSIIAIVFLMAGATFGIREMVINSQRIYQPSENESRNSSDQSTEKGIQGAIDFYKMNNAAISEIISVRKIVEAYNKKHYSKSGSSEWIEMGPENIGGRSRAILWDERDPSYNTLYAGGVAGGLFISKNRGYSWEIVRSIGVNISVTTICQAPDMTIFVGTGEDLHMQGIDGSGNNSTSSGNIGHGLYRTVSPSSDQFEIVPGTNISEGDVFANFAYINRVAYHPTENYLYVGTNRGIFVSSNKGDSWLNSTSNSVGTTQDIKITNDGVIYYSIGGSGNFRLRKATLPTLADGKDVFSINNIKVLPKPVGIGRIEIAVAPKQSSHLPKANDYVYISVADANGTFSGGKSIGIYRSTDKGDTWQIKSNEEVHKTLFGTSNQGRYDNVIAIYPNNLEQVLLGGIEMWRGKVQKGDKGVFSWERVSIASATQVADRENFYDYIYNTRYVHADAHAITFHPNPKSSKDSNTFFIGTDGGISFSDDGGVTFKTLNKGFNVTQFYGLAVGNDGSLIGGTQDNSTPYIWKDEVDTNKRALMLWSGDGGWSAISSFQQTLPTRKKCLFLTSQNAGCARTQGNYLDISNNQEWNWGMDFRGHPGGSSVIFDSGSFVTPMILWETISDTKIKDSIEINLKFGDTITRGATQFLITNGVVLQPGDVVAKYHNSKPHFDYPFIPTISGTYTVTDDDFKLMVKNPIQSRFFIGANNNKSGRGGVFMTDQAIDFSKKPPRWFPVLDLPIPARNADVVTNLAITPDGNTLFVASTSNLYRITNLLLPDFNDWNNQSNLLKLDTLSNPAMIANFPRSRTITSICIDPQNNDNLIVTFGGYTPLNPNIPNVLVISGATTNTPTAQGKTLITNKLPVYTSLIEKSNPNVVFFGTEYGMYKTTNLQDLQPTFTPVNDGMNIVPVYRIIQQTKDMPNITLTTGDKIQKWRGTDSVGAIYIATHGRGIFKSTEYQVASAYNDLNLKNPSSKNLSGINNVSKNENGFLQVYPNPATTQTTIEFSLKNNGSKTILIIYDLRGTEIYSEQVNNTAKGEKTIKQIDCSKFKKGVYLVRIVSEEESITSKLIVK